MKIAIIGNCQIEPIAEALSLSADLDVDVFALALLRAEGRALTEAHKLSQYDHLLVQPLDVLSVVPEYAPYHPSQLSSICANVMLIPNITFTGFHPDCTAVTDINGNLLRTPIGEYSSALIAAAFSLGLSPQRAKKLFNAFIYERADYMSEAGKAIAYLYQHGDDCAFDLRPLASSWFEHGSFMHTMNHPAAFVLEDLAKKIGERLGASTKTIQLNVDRLAQNTIWPTYPEIAKQFGFAGSLQFKVAHVDEFIGLEALIEGSYASYAGSAQAIREHLSVKRAVQAISDQLVTAYG